MSMPLSELKNKRKAHHICTSGFTRDLRITLPSTLVQTQKPNDPKMKSKPSMIVLLNYSPVFSLLVSPGLRVDQVFLAFLLPVTFNLPQLEDGLHQLLNKISAGRVSTVGSVKASSWSWEDGRAKAGNHVDLSSSCVDVHTCPLTNTHKHWIFLLLFFLQRD